MKMTFLGKKKDGPIKGYIERIDDSEIHGWAINRKQEALNLSLRIDGKDYPVSPSWHERADVTANFGAEFPRPGFTIKIPDALAEIVAAGRQNNVAIVVLANQVALINKTKAANVTAKAKPFAGGKVSAKANNRIRGHVEQIENLELQGWVLNLDKEPLTLALQVGDSVYPVSPIWNARLDVAENFGNDFIRTGFSVEVPDDLVDPFLLACRNGGDAMAIDILANGVSLHNTCQQKSLAFDLLPSRFIFADFVTINAKQGIYVTAKDLQNLLLGEGIKALQISENPASNASFYLELAKYHLKKQNLHAGRSLLKASIVFAKRAEVFELLGDTYFEQTDYETAAAHYQEATENQGTTSKLLFANLADCKARIPNPKAVVETFLKGIAKSPEASLLLDRLDDLVREYWLKQQGELEVLAISNDRDGLLAKTTEVSSFIYEAYLNAFGASKHQQYLGTCNLQRILIVADMHIPQCVRYRIEQKVEHLELLEKEVTVISWSDLASEQDALVFHDLVIFYRVPAEPQVLKAMAQVNAASKLSFYEIDDLLFEASYPPPIETYGGYLELNHYIQILKGMASFNAAARSCRFGIASTQPLADKLAELVFDKHCFVHRNGVDSTNVFKQKTPEAIANKKTIDIFYGSGTMAHNSDFNDLALPAISRLLDEYKHVGLTVAGYLKLPSDFLARYEGRVRQMPPVKNIKTYWALLERADINLAVLHDDSINGCKSELKWFEAACLGIPSVMSSTANYRDVIRQNEDGLMATTSDEWYQHLKALIVSPELRQDMAALALARVEAEYSVEALANNIDELLNAAQERVQELGFNTRKKIALVNVYFPPQSIGGATRVVADNIDVLQRDYRDQFELCVFTSDAEHKQPYKMTVYNHNGIRVYRSTIMWRENMDWYATDENMGELFEAFLEAEQPDLVHFHCIQRLGGALIEATQKAEIPYIVTTHDAWWISDHQFLVDAENKVYPEAHPDPYAPYTPPSFTTLSESMERVLYLKSLLQGAYDVLTVSDSFAGIYRKNEVPKIRVNKNGISDIMPWQVKDTSRTDKVVCGHVGGMAEHKGYFLLKRAIFELQPANIELLIVNHAEDEGFRLETYWGKVPVTFIGRTSQARVVELYRQIDVLFAPSTWPESFGLVTREAAACGCWVVASNMGGIGEDIIEGKTGFVIEPNVNAISRCLETIAKNTKQFKAPTHTPSLRSVKEQINELAGIYRNL